VLALLSILMLAGPRVGLTGSLNPGTLTIYVVNYPLRYFAQRIAGSHAQIVFPAPADEDPAFWTPDLETIGAYQAADLILLNGATYAKWVEKVTLPRSKLVDTSAAFKDRYIPVKEARTHTHGPGGEHAHTGIAFTTWLDPSLAARQARAIADAMIRKRPELRKTFEENYAALESDLEELDRTIGEIIALRPAQPLVASHPVYDYLARRYNLNLKSVHWEPDEIPTDAQWTELRNLLQDHPATWMVWEGESLQASVDELSTRGVNSLVFDPCGNVPEEGDFLSVMNQNVENLKAAFR
jgi:zinc transport system substrate-binding protein